MRTGQEQKLINSVEKTIDKWQLFSKNEKLLIGVSGGKDSLALLDCLFILGYKNLNTIHIQVSDSAPVSFEQYCRDRSVFTLIKTDILSEIANRQRKNLCYMCSRAKRKTICGFAVEQGFTKVVLAHHKNDVIETLLLNLLFQCELSTMMPKQELFAGKLEIIRPFYETEEQDVSRYANKCNLPVSDWRCGIESDSRRAWIKQQITMWQKTYPKLKITENIFQALMNVNLNFLPNASIYKKA